MDSILQIVATITETETRTTYSGSDGVEVFWFIVISIATIWIIKK
jgi:hypothetical protein